MPEISTTKAFLRRIIAPLRLLRSLGILLSGYSAYARTGKTPERAYQAMIMIFCLTRGHFNELLSNFIAKRRPKVQIDHPVGLLGNLQGQRGKDLHAQLKRDGFIVFPSALPAEACDRLMEMAMSTPASVRRMDHEPEGAPQRTALFQPGNLLATRYDYNPSTLLDTPDVQALLADPSILHLVQEYLGCLPLADVLSMWWHTDYQKKADSNAAQLYHFDMDRVKWLKIFIYLTDVGPQNGPHSFIKGTHRPKAIPAHLLQRGYARITDDEVQEAFSEEACMEFCAPRGSIIIEDTRGLHKGATVSGDARLILQLQFSNSLFGTNYPEAKFSKVIDPNFKKMLGQAPEIYRQYS